jgi:hypothetical protein
MTKKLYAWDLRELDLATLSGDIVVHCSNEYKCRVTRAHADKVHVVCNPPPDYKNPRIDLDRGGTVWGFQCWWGPEDFVRKQLQGHELVEVPLPSDEAN